MVQNRNPYGTKDSETNMMDLTYIAQRYRNLWKRGHQRLVDSD